MSVDAWMAVDPLLLDRARLAIVATLVREEHPVAFIILAERLNLTRGNLSAHARKLEEGGLVAVTKRFLDRKPVTLFSCTDKGRETLRAYLGALEGLLRNAKPEA